MFGFICPMLLCFLVANGQPLSCKEDVHCSEGYYCETQVNMCLRCLRCQDLKRDPPKLDISNAVCIKLVDKCGPCFKGFINIYRNGVKGMCVLTEFFEFRSGSHYGYIWITATLIGLLIVATFVYDTYVFVYVIRYTYVFRVRVVAHDNFESDSETSPPAGTLITPKNLRKYLLQFDKNLTNK